MQSLIVALILLLCVAYTARRLWRRLTAPPQADVRCEGCPLADTCKHRGQHGQHPGHHRDQHPGHHRDHRGQHPEHPGYPADCPQGAKCDCCK